MEELLTKWRELYDLRASSTALIDAQIAELTSAKADIAAPFAKPLADIEAQIKQEALAVAKSVKAAGVSVGYRRGYQRVSYNSDQVDAVLGVLRDVLPETANTLQGARVATMVAPSVSIKREG
jgi:uncharacterized protein YijF (DUF1287 family)